MDGAANWYEVVRSEYNKIAPPLSQNKAFAHITTPLDFENVHMKTFSEPATFTTVSMHAAPLWLAAKEASGSDAAAEMEGVFRKKVFFFGPGTMHLRNHVAQLQGIPGLSADVLTSCL